MCSDSQLNSMNKPQYNQESPYNWAVRDIVLIITSNNGQVLFLSKLNL